jgi:SAM-dependent methyltransferase
LAETCEVVVAADACPEYIRFAALRARQKDQTNIIPLQLGLDQPLPFAPSSFDTVVLLDALSWVRDPDAQRLALRRVRAVLKPAGSLVLADTNRFSAMRLAMRSRTGNPRSVQGYQRLLQSVGFRHFRVYALAPSHLEPFFIIPLDRWTPLDYFLREIICGQDFGVHFTEPNQRMLYYLIRAAVRRTPSRLLVRFTAPFIPSVGIVATT